MKKKFAYVFSTLIFFTKLERGKHSLFLIFRVFPCFLLILAVKMFIFAFLLLVGKKKAHYRLKFNTCTCRQIQRDLTTTYYPNPKPKHKNGIKFGPGNSNHNPHLDINHKAAIFPKIRRRAALGLALPFLI